MVQERNGENSEVWGKGEKPLTNELLELLKETESIEQFANEYVDCFVDITFKDYLNSLIESKGMKKSTVIRASGLSDSYAFQIFQGFKSPSRDKLLSLAIAMRLSIEECQRLLKLAGVNELYAKNRRDAIILFGLNKGLSVPQTNDLLFDLEEFTL